MIAVVTVGMLLAFAASVLAATRGALGARFVGLQLAGVIATQLTIVLSLQPGVSYYADVALLLVLVAFIANLLFSRFLERWL